MKTTVLITAFLLICQIGAQELSVSCDEESETGMLNLESSSHPSGGQLIISEEGCQTTGSVAATKSPILDPVLDAGFDFEVADDFIDLGSINLYARYADGSGIGTQVRTAKNSVTSIGLDCAQAITTSAQHISCEILSRNVAGVITPYVNFKGAIKVGIKNYQGPRAIFGLSVIAATGSYQEATFTRTIEAGGPDFNLATQNTGGTTPVDVIDTTGRVGLLADQSAPVEGYQGGFIVNFPYNWADLVNQAGQGDQSTNFESNGGAVGSNSGVSLRVSYQPEF